MHCYQSAIGQLVAIRLIAGVTVLQLRWLQMLRDYVQKGLVLFLSVSVFPAQALTLNVPELDSDLIGEAFSVVSQNEYTLAGYARAYGLGFREIVAANPHVNPWVPGNGATIVLPVSFLLPVAERRDVVLNLAEMRLFYFLQDQQTILSYPIGIGREGWSTPEMRAKVVTTIANPTWTPTPAILKEHAEQGDPLPAIVPPGPDNPLGEYAVQLDKAGYFLHGTNKDLGVGMRISHGCIRLYPEDIEELVRRITRGTDVVVVNQPVKVGWHQGQLYLEVHEPLAEQRDEWDALAAAKRLVDQALQTRAVTIDEGKLATVVQLAQGVPVRISLD